jgi:signal peptidase
VTGRGRTALAAGRIAGLWLAIGFVFALFFAAAAPLAIGDHSYVLRSGSMAPTIDTGDVEVARPISPLEARVGDIITFRDSKWGNRLVSHRARAIQRVGDNVNFITQGDANTGREHWSVPVSGTIGRVVYRIPKLGWAVAVIGTPAGRVGLIVLPAVLLMVSLLVRLWRRQPDVRPETSDELAA